MITLNLTPELWSKACAMGIKIASTRTDLENGMHGFANTVSVGDAKRLGILPQDGAAP